MTCDAIWRRNQGYVTSGLMREIAKIAYKLDSMPSGYCINHVPRPSATKNSRGGELCIIHRDTIQVKPNITVSYGTFECRIIKLCCSGTLSSSSNNVTMAVDYRPPSMSNIEAFYDNLSDLLDQLGDVIDGDRFVCCGDFNCSGVYRTADCV